MGALSNFRPQRPERSGHESSHGEPQKEFLSGTLRNLRGSLCNHLKTRNVSINSKADRVDFHPCFAEEFLLLLARLILCCFHLFCLGFMIIDLTFAAHIAK